MSPEPARIRVEVVAAVPDRAWRVDLQLDAGCTAAAALERAGLIGQVPGLDRATLTLAIYGTAVTAATVLHDGDRLELLRPLLADPKQARRRRARGQGG